jgi:carbon monoxide dehydrogenase subunit G
VRIEQTFMVASSPDSVFDYMTDPANLRDWQTSKTKVEPLAEGPPRLGYRVREWTKPPGRKEFAQVVEFTEFDRPHRLHVHIVEGPYPVDGMWVLSAVGDGTRVEFVAEGPLNGAMRLAEPLVRRMMGREFAKYHETCAGTSRPYQPPIYRRREIRKTGCRAAIRRSSSSGASAPTPWKNAPTSHAHFFR